MSETLDFFYDGQMRRYLEQIVRGFSVYQVADGFGNTKRVPCRMALKDRMVANLIANGSEATLNTLPMITVAMTDLAYEPSLQGDNSMVSTKTVYERRWDEEEGRYTNEGGAMASVDRIYPRPFKMSFQVDLWTSNEMQKHQLIEQIMVAVVPSFEIQSSENAVDWTALATVFFENMVYTSRSVPIGTTGSEEIDVTTISFNMPFYLNPPSRIRRSALIHQIVTNVFTTDGSDGATFGDDMFTGGGDLAARSITTPDNMAVIVERGTLTLVDEFGNTHDKDGNLFNWDTYLSSYLQPRYGQTQVYLTIGNDIESKGVSGIITLTPEPNVLGWQIDPMTLKANTLAAVSGVIDPLTAHPLNGRLPSPVSGTRYVLTSDISSNVAWGGLIAKANDIIEYDDVNGWRVAFDSQSASGVEYVLNSNTTSQLRYADGDWTMAIDGEYSAGHWRIII